MHTLRHIIWLLLAVSALLLGLAGCNGPAPGLDPAITFTDLASGSLTSFPSGGVLSVKGEGTTADSAGNPITSYRWTATRADGGDPGQFGSTATLETVWQAPIVVAPVNVTLQVTAKTLLGGKTTRPLTVRVVPPTATTQLKPIIVWDFENMNKQNASIAIPNIVMGTALRPLASITLLDTTDKVTSYAWTKGGVASTLAATDTLATVWTPTAIGEATLTLTVNTQKGATQSSILTFNVIAATVPTTLNPTIDWNISGMNSQNATKVNLPNIVSGTTINLLATPISSDPTNDPITGYTWTSSRADLLSSLDTKTTSWTAPTGVATGWVRLDVTTLKGHTAGSTLNFIIQPVGTTVDQYPAITWNITAMNYKNADGTKDIIRLPWAASGSTLNISGTPTLPDTDKNSIVSYTWLTPQRVLADGSLSPTMPDGVSPVGKFFATDVLNTAWVAPSAGIPALPNGLPVVLHLQTKTLAGATKDSYLFITVSPNAALP